MKRKKILTLSPRKQKKPAAKKRAPAKPKAKPVTKPVTKQATKVNFTSHPSTNPASVDMGDMTLASKAMADENRRQYIASDRSSAMSKAKTSVSAPMTNPGK